MFVKPGQGQIDRVRLGEPELDRKTENFRQIVPGTLELLFGKSVKA